MTTAETTGEGVILCETDEGPIFWSTADRSLRIESGDWWTEHPTYADTLDLRVPDLLDLHTRLTQAYLDHPCNGPVWLVDTGDFETCYGYSDRKGVAWIFIPPVPLSTLTVR